MKSALLVIGIFLTVGTFIALAWGWPLRQATPAEKELAHQENVALNIAGALGTNDLKLMQLYSDGVRAGARMGPVPHYASDEYYTEFSKLFRQRKALQMVRDHHWKFFRNLASSLGIFAAVAFILAGAWPGHRV